MAKVDKPPSLYPLQPEGRKQKIIPCLMPAMNQTLSFTGGIPLYLPPAFWELLRAQRVSQHVVGRRKQREARVGHARPVSGAKELGLSGKTSIVLPLQNIE